ncbi:hypothetical protein FKM82_026190 [Ascaphus truei]
MRRSCTCLLLYSVCFLEISIQGTSEVQRPQWLPYPKGEVNLLSQSLLQLGSGLKREVNHTRERVNSILKHLDIFNTSLAQLFGQVIQTAKLGEDLDTKARHFIGSYNRLYQVVTELYEDVAELQRHRASLDTKLKPLEKKMQKAVNSSMERDSFLSTSNILSVRSQSIQIDALMAVVDIHQGQIDAQDAIIERLLRKTESRKMKIKRHQNGST